MAPTRFGFAERHALAEWLDRRMVAHQRNQHATEKRLIEEIIDEVQALPKRQPRSGMLLEFPAQHLELAQ